MNSYFYSVREVFEVLNNAGVNYLVLRNYEKLLTPQFFVEGHPDIDILCEDSQIIVRLLDATSLRPDVPPFLGDGTHYQISVGGSIVSLDLRYVGDGYYDSTWQKEMLKNRINRNGIFTVSDEDYFYSLIYHAVFQKRVLSPEYMDRLSEMSRSFATDLEIKDEVSLIVLLEHYMRTKGYRYEYSIDKMVPNRFYLGSRSLRSFNLKRWIKHFCFDAKCGLIEILVTIKHKLIV